MNERIDTWMAALEARQLADLTFSEVSRALRALSSAYVERRSKLKEGAALSGAGKRAAFALFYGPLHFLTVQHIVTTIGEPFTAVDALLDLGCGTGAAGAGWATACVRQPTITGIDRNPWAIEEARRTYADLGLRATVRVGDMTRTGFGGPGRPRAGSRDAILLAYAVNELTETDARDALLARLLEHACSGGHVLVVEPLAGFVAPWWSGWREAFVSAGGRADEWRFRADLPAIVEKLDRAAGLNHRELKARSLSI